MNYNASAGQKQPFGRKIKRVVDVNAMGYNPSPYGSQPPGFPTNGADMGTPQLQRQGFRVAPGVNDYPQMQGVPGGQPQMQPQAGDAYSGFNAPPAFSTPVAPGAPGLGVFGQPMVQNMAMQYTQQLASESTTAVKKEFEKYVPVSRLKYYFAVDTKYVVAKLGLLFFPFTHTDWSLKYVQDGPAQPRLELNAPDLYIPTMAYVTYILVAGLLLGTQSRFSPEQISIQASSALAWCLFELLIYSCTLYVCNIQTALRTLDLLAYCGYKFVGITVSILLSVATGTMGYFCTLAYLSLALAFFLVRSLKAQVLAEPAQAQQGYYTHQPSSGNKRRLYFLLFVAGAQPFLSWWLSFHLLRHVPLAIPVS